MDYGKIKEWIIAILQRIHKIFAMNEETWKHCANPWSLWTRLVCVWVLILAIYARVWWGMASWLIVVVALLWIWLNPRIFPIPKTTKRWSSFATFGERVWLNRKMVRIPRDQEYMANALTILMLVNIFPLAYGLIEVDLPYVVFPTVIHLICKLWFYDRMVWLFTHMQSNNPTYASWIY